MKIAVDIDDVLVDCNAAINAFLAEEKGIFLNREDWQHFDLEMNTGHSLEEAIQIYKDFHISSHLEEPALIDGVEEAIGHLSKSHTIIAVTSRGEDIDRVTQKIIEKFTGTIGGLFYTNQYNRDENAPVKTTKGVICQREGVT